MKGAATSPTSWGQSLGSQERKAWPHTSVTRKMGDLVQWQEEQRLCTSARGPTFCGTWSRVPKGSSSPLPTCVSNSPPHLGPPRLQWRGTRLGLGIGLLGM